MLALRTISSQGATIRLIVNIKIIAFIVRRYIFFPRASSKLIFNYFQLFKMKAVRAECKI